MITPHGMCTVMPQMHHSGEAFALSLCWLLLVCLGLLAAGCLYRYQPLLDEDFQLPAHVGIPPYCKKLVTGCLRMYSSFCSRSFLAGCLHMYMPVLLAVSICLPVCLAASIYLVAQLGYNGKIVQLDTNDGVDICHLSLWHVLQMPLFLLTIIARCTFESIWPVCKIHDATAL